MRFFHLIFSPQAEILYETFYVDVMINMQDVYHMQN